MDLQVCAIIAIVFCVSFVSLWFINGKLRGGKTFEDVLAEKRSLADKLYGSKYQKKPQRKVKKEKKEKRAKERKEQEPEPESQNDSDEPSDSVSGSSSPTHSKAHVEFSEPEIVTEDVVVPTKKNLNKRNQNRKNSATKPILVNKSEIPIVTTATISVEVTNHFEETLPKDDMEVKKHQNELQSNKRDAKRSKDKKVSPKIEKPQEIVAVVETIVAKEHVVEQNAPKESPKNAPAKDKQNKKKKNEQLVAIDEPEHINVNSMMIWLSRSDLTRGEIQILIDYLLNKQQDTIVNHSDWSDDILQKLRKQLADSERKLSDEQEAAAGFQVKLREMRTELNNERLNNQKHLSAYVEELAAKKLELQTISQENHYITEKYNSEKQSLIGQVQQLQQLQQKLFQEKQNSSVDTTQKLAQITDANAVLTQENYSKERVLNDLQEKFHKFQNENELQLQELQRLVRQREQELQLMNVETQRLRADAACKEEYEKIFEMRNYELEQLKAQVNEQNNKANHLDDSSKVEIRNLQNALDSSRKELSMGKAQLAEKDSILVTYKTQMDQQSSKINELEQEITESKEINNIPEVIKVEPVAAISKEDEQRTKQMLERLFPDCPAGPANYSDWVNHMDAYIQKINSVNKFNKNNSNSNSEPINSTTNSTNTTTTTTTTNHVNSTTKIAKSNGNVTPTTTTQSDADIATTEDLILQNAKLQSTVFEYKTIVAETEVVLTNLEKRVIEQDAYWRSVVESKDTEIQNIKTGNNVDI